MVPVHASTRQYTPVHASTRHNNLKNFKCLNSHIISKQEKRATVRTLLGKFFFLNCCRHKLTKFKTQVYIQFPRLSTPFHAFPRQFFFISEIKYTPVHASTR